MRGMKNESFSVPPGIYRVFSTIYDTEQVFLDRPNGGNWITFANTREKNYNYRDHIEYNKHNYAGERLIYLEESLQAKALGVHVFDPHGFPVAIYHWGEEGNQVAVDIPVLTIDEMQDLQLILNDAIDRVVKDISKPLKTFLKDKKQLLPKHLTSVPLQKQYLNSTGALLFATIREAMSRGELGDGGYDNEVECPYPMVFVINK